jgi:hypothetical protein
MKPCVSPLDILRDQYDDSMRVLFYYACFFIKGNQNVWPKLGISFRYENTKAKKITIHDEKCQLESKPWPLARYFSMFTREDLGNGVLELQEGELTRDSAYASLV